MPVFNVKNIKKSGKPRVRLITDGGPPVVMDVQTAKNLAAALFAAAQVADPDDGFLGPGGITVS